MNDLDKLVSEINGLLRNNILRESAEKLPEEMKAQLSG